MITPEQRREIKRLTNELVKSQLGLLIKPDSREVKKQAKNDIRSLETYLDSITTKG